MTIRGFLILILAIFFVMLPAVASAQSDQQNQSDQLNSAGALYSQSVDLANAGKYEEALQVSDQALALNVTSLVPLIQTNRAGILVMLGRYEEANAAADAALSREGNLTTTHSIAWYNKGNALRALGRLTEAQTAYAQAYALDSSLVPPDLATATIPPSTPQTATQTLTHTTSQTTTQSPLPWFMVPVSIGLFIMMGNYRRCPRK
jgi:tetratricopeptide (TPR) repeat protein